MCRLCTSLIKTAKGLSVLSNLLLTLLHLLQGETVPYIICVPRSDDGQPAEEAPKGLAERAYHPEEVNGNPKLTVDTNYYLANQVCPSSLRICLSSSAAETCCFCLKILCQKEQSPLAVASELRNYRL